MSSTTVAHSRPVVGIIPYLLGRFGLWIAGWKLEGRIPAGRKFVLIAAPHTSNWDFPLLIAATFSLRLKISWFGKDSLFKKPFGWFMRGLGGIAVDRSAPQGLVEQLVEQFQRHDKLVVVVPPSGTRARREYWKSGFYWIALKAQVPLLCGFLDFKRKVAGLGLSFLPTGNVKADMDRLREFYSGISGKFPEKVSVIRLKDESDPE
ncbi:MAG: lysophospholipid acyltransferase family protein [Candidatus Neomarinimicrobiota bacterium]